MAITQNPLIGASSGKFGGAVFSRSFGKNQIRSMPVSVNQPNTDAQKLVQQKLSATVSVIKSLLPFLILALGKAVKNMPTFSWATGYAVKNAASGTLDNVILDYENLVPAPDASGLLSMITADKSSANEVTLDWDSATMQAALGTDAEVCAALVDEATGAVYLGPSGVTVSDETMVLTVPGTNTSKSFALYFAPVHNIVRFKSGNEMGVSVK